MCILFVYRDPEATKNSYRLIVASNRDEVYRRPALPAHYWKGHPDCLGGTDNEPGREGGTWFGLSLRGRAGIILNLTGETKPPDDPGKGRGRIIVDYLDSEDNVENYLTKLHDANKKFQLYNPYNLVLLDIHDAGIHYLTNSPNSTGPQIYKDRIFGISNSLLAQPYAKVEAGKEKFAKIIGEAKISERDRLIEDLRQLLKWKKRHLPDPELQKRSPDWYEKLSSIYVCDESAGYGTRTHSILLVDGSNNVTFVEETLLPDGTWKTQTFEHTLK